MKTTNTFEINGEQYILQDDTVKNICTVEENLYNKETSIDGKYLASDNSLKDNDIYTTSDYIPVEKNESYVLTNKARFIHLYNDNKELIYAYNDANEPNISINTTSDTAYVRISINKDYKDTFMLQQGTEITKYYIPYNKRKYEIIYDAIPIISTDKIDKKSIVYNNLADDITDNFFVYNHSQTYISISEDKKYVSFIISLHDNIDNYVKVIIRNCNIEDVYRIEIIMNDETYVYELSEQIIIPQNTNNFRLMLIFKSSVQYDDEYYQNILIDVYTHIDSMKKSINALKNNNTYTISGNTTSAYYNITQDNFIKNSKVHNDSDMSISFFNYDRTKRLTVMPHQKIQLDDDYLYLQTLEKTGDYNIIINDNTISEINGNTIIKNTIDLNRLSFLNSFNIYDEENDADKAVGKYITYEDELKPNEIYTTYSSNKKKYMEICE